MSKELLFSIGCVSASLCVAFGAFGAHALKDIEPNLKKTWETAASYQMYHSIGIIIASMLSKSASSSYAAYLFIVGILLFSGSLYTLVLTKIKILGAITPFGGMAFIIGWLCLAMHR